MLLFSFVRVARSRVDSGGLCNAAFIPVGGLRFDFCTKLSCSASRLHLLYRVRCLCLSLRVVVLLMS